MGKNQHIVPVGEKWGIKGEGNEQYTRIVSTQREAIEIGRGIAQNQHSELLIHGEDGRIRDKRSFGNDPCPPRDKR
ncbi:hypothetical protein Palpr_2812 [Paludibacter propionicigenes WB4]|uniref:DUF2188 domain-containing protein n=1 Tax=Paludibacter propionicigenes (strain DSM 17365 / JCM 13257 / WB4) TaxID=694427 RepID=E4T897_PALPW|nr:DUF2188 domain-containing protein [Paludibacter propionicigenes]ADQ80941.1 hypothetical protein Palpr_2812 [Paludibacter propionicigenes WB4]